MTSTRRWTGWSTGRTTSRSSWPRGTWPRRPTPGGWRCSTCHRRGWKARAARWLSAATPGTARKAGCRSRTGCSPTPKAARSRSASGPRPRQELLAATEKLLAPIIARVAAGRLAGAGEIGVAVGKVISKYNTAKHFDVTITDDSLAVQRRQAQIDAESALDGFYVIRTAVPASELGAPAVVTAYKNLKYAGRDFRHLKAGDLDLRPIWHRLEERVRAHVLICMLACYLTWHLRKAWAPLTFTDQNPPAPGDPAAPARRSAAARAKASRHHDQAGRPYRSFRALLP